MNDLLQDNRSKVPPSSLGNDNQYQANLYQHQNNYTPFLDNQKPNVQNANPSQFHH